MRPMTVETLPPPVWVDTPTALFEMISVLADHPRIAVDTESNSLHAYQEQVCLIQFSTLKVDYLLDPLALPDLESLAPFFADSRIEKIFHAAEYDLICLKRDFGFEFANLFDTMQAARILGYKAFGLNSLLAEKFEVKVNKRYQKANWGSRPLRRDMIDYARIDTHYLIELRDLLKAELVAKGLWELAKEDFERASLNNGHRSKSPGHLWEKLSGYQDLSPRELAVLNKLCNCRERMAQRLDRPPFKVIEDKYLIALAKAMPQSSEDLELAGLTQKQIRLLGKSILTAVESGLKSDPIVRSRPERPNSDFLSRLDALKDWRKKVARKVGVQSDVVLPRPYLYDIAEGNPNDTTQLAALMADTPWRLERYGQDILKVIDQS